MFGVAALRRWKAVAPSVYSDMPAMLMMPSCVREPAGSVNARLSVRLVISCMEPSSKTSMSPVTICAPSIVMEPRMRAVPKSS